MNNGEITQLSIRELLGGGDRYLIPMYQRNYAWEEGEITQLIQDVIDSMSAKNGAPVENYYIGTLVVYRRPDTTGKAIVFETIDGQQRLTTLSLLTSYLKRELSGGFEWPSGVRLEFESRPHSQKTFVAISEVGPGDDPAARLSPDDTNAAILNGYQLVQKHLRLKLDESKARMETFAAFLLDRVQIMRVEVPPDTDLNHYFEIMNNRGEQLEKHEVLKSRLLEALEKIPDPGERTNSQSCLHQVWESCANMEKYVQMGFVPAQRNAVFGQKNWGQFIPADFDTLRSALGSATDPSSTEKLKLTEIIATAHQHSTTTETDDTEPPERFNSVINFPNFLLHVLRVETGEDVPLDDKRLLPTFEEKVLKAPDPVTRVKRFTYSLLRCKFLYDHYIIKREFLKGTDGWSLKRLKWTDGGARNRSGRNQYVDTFGEEAPADINANRSVLMLLAAFHVSTPTLVYKHWLNAALRYLFTNKGKIEAAAYLAYLESTAKAFVFDRFLANAPLEYFDIIYHQKSVCQTRQNTINREVMKQRLTFGCIENNLVFNFLDYLLWQQHRASDAKVREYEFTFRSSVEHYYPQNPMPGHDRMNSAALNSFGNLCLISHSKNSRLSNFMPEAKKEYYRANVIDSVKQRLMMHYTQWDESAITDHEQQMLDVLIRSLDAH